MKTDNNKDYYYSTEQKVGMAVCFIAAIIYAFRDWFNF